MTVLPDLVDAPARLGPALAELRPHTLVVGVNRVDRAAIEQWVAAMAPEERPAGRSSAPGAREGRRRLLVVRRGTSLAAIDLAAANEHAVDVVSTPEVNARYIAEFVVDRLLAPPGPPAAVPCPTAATATPDTVGLIGGGNIGRRVAQAATSRGFRVVVFTPSLSSDPQAAAAWRRTVQGTRRDADVLTAPSVETVFASSDLVGIAVPLTSTGPHATHGLVRGAHVRSFAGRRIVSVSEPDVFTVEAISEAYRRRDLDVVLDNAAGLLAPVRRQITEDLENDGKGLRAGFSLSSAAMRTPGCGEDLDQAFLVAVAGPELAAHPEPPVRSGRGGDDADIVVVGAGIVGLTTALVLHAGGAGRVRVVDAAPADRADAASQGTTFGGSNARHMSSTETVPHADASRAHALARPPADGGWLLRDPASLSVIERAWVSAFERCADSPGLYAVTADLVIELNHLGLRLWEQLFDRYPDVFGGLRLDGPLARAYLSGEDLAAGIARQTLANRRVRALSVDETLRHWPALEGCVPRPGGGGTLSGVVEVDGYAANIHDLATAVHDRLARDGVAVHAGARIARIERRPDGVRLALADGSTLHAGHVVLTVGGRHLDALLAGTWAPSGCVQQVLGLSLTLPNPGLHRPLKVHADDPLGVVNVTLSPDASLVHASGGFGYLGLAPPDSCEPAAIASLAAAFDDTLGTLFPGLRGPHGRLEVVDRRICERPMTPDGLPVVDAPPGFGGRVVVVAGTNAGGTVQAPALASLVARMIDGQHGCAHLAMATSRPVLARYAEERLASEDVEGIGPGAGHA